MSAEQTPTVEKKIEEIPSDDEEAPGLEPVENPELAQGGNKRQNRGEKKIRKHLAKTGLTQVTGVTKMAVRKGGQTLFVVAEPDVFKSPSGEIFVVFGEPKVDQGSSALQAAAGGLTGAPSGLSEEAPALAEETTGASASADSEEFSGKDIDLVMTQGNCTREKAVEALRKTKGDIVTAIMELTMAS